MKKILALVILSAGFGTVSAQSVFPTNGANVGIGTTNPTDKFQIEGNQFSIRNSTTNNGILFNVNAFGHPAIIPTNGIGTMDKSLLLAPYGGNVGVGVTDPSAKLDVTGTAKFGGQSANLDISGNPIAYQSLAGTGKILMGWNRTGGQGETDFVANEGAGSHGGFAFYSYNNASQEKQLLRLMGNGNVGIGTANPQDKLTVAGNIGAREIKVSTNAGADFVFEPDYKLPDLAELEKFVKTNKHLPEIPTAKQMVENGVNLGELNIKLLQKVEELTLHLIEKDKAIEGILKRMDEIEQKVKK